MKRLITVLFLLACLGCAHNTSFVEHAYDTIASANYTVNAMMEVAGLEHCAGNLTDEQKSRIIAAYAQYKLAADLADEALAVYAATEKEDDKLAYVRALAELLDNEKIIIDVLNAFLEVDHDR